MARFIQGKYSIQNPKKYIGDPTNCVFRSSWERKVMVKFDESPRIVKWGSEPFHIFYHSPVDNRRHRYFPDFIVVARSDTGELITTLIEVKPAAECVPPVARSKKKERYLQECCTFSVNQAKWAAAREVCRQRNWRFVVMTEKEINP